MYYKIFFCVAVFVFLALQTQAKMPQPPNGGFFVEVSSDVNINQQIIKKLQEFKYELQNADLKKLKLIWRLKDIQRHMLSVFESPDVIRVDFEIPGQNGEQSQKQRIWSLIPHQAVDVCRSDIGLSANIHAPISGYVFVIQEQNVDIIFTTYTTSVAIYNPETQIVTVLLHAKPRIDLTQAVTPVYVERGEIIGELSSEVPGLVLKSEELCHVHVYILQLNNGQVEIVNPFAHFQDVTDHISPALDEVYLYDAQAQKQKKLVNGAIDIVIKTHDRINNSTELIPPYEMSYSLLDQKGRVIQKAENCIFENWLRSDLSYGYLQIYSSMYDLMGTYDEASDQNWPLNYTTASVSQRYYRFVLNHFKQNEKTNLCELLIATGKENVVNTIEINPTIHFLKLKLKIKDRAGNIKYFEHMLSR